MKMKFTLVLFLSMTASVLYGPLQAQPPHHHHWNHRHITGTMVHFNQDMRKLWEDHITWTRNVICNILDNLPGTNEAVARLLQNQADIGNAIKPFYGNAAGDALTGLLNGHINTAATLLIALRDNDAAGLAAANAAWYANADSIVEFLHAANPDNWSLADLDDMMDTHLDLTISEASARKNMDYAADVAAYDSVHMEILEMADMLSVGIIRQFPMQFWGHGNRSASQEVVLNDGESVLNQNAPNPFMDQTTITYYIPENTAKAEIQFFNESGMLIKSVTVTAGEGTLTVHSGNLRNGTYTYSLIADGKIVDTRKMMH
jgi:hypothetical protein